MKRTVNHFLSRVQILILYINTSLQCKMVKFLVEFPALSAAFCSVNVLRYYKRIGKSKDV